MGYLLGSEDVAGVIVSRDRRILYGLNLACRDNSDDRHVPILPFKPVIE